MANILSNQVTAVLLLFCDVINQSISHLFEHNVNAKIIAYCTDV